MTTYYVSAAGSDTNAGTSTGAPWQHISKVNSTTLVAGDIVNFRGGDTFSDAQLYIPESGSSGNPITIQSYGTGNATLANASTSSDAVYLYDAAWVTIQNLNIQSSAGFASVKNGIEFYGDAAQYQGIVIQNCVISGYINGIKVGGSGNTLGTSGMQILNNSISSCRDFGIQTYGPGTFVASQFQHAGITIQGNTVTGCAGDTTNTTSATGYGMALGGLSSSSVIQQNLVHGNGGSNGYTSGGPVGIMVYNSDSTTVQFNVCYSQGSGTSADGDGIDLDINTSNSTVQYNVSYSNAGAGILLWNATSSNWTGNTVRWNMCWGNCTSNSYGEIYLGGTISSSSIYNNTCIGRTARPAVNIDNTGTKTSINFYNNIFYAGSTGNVVTGLTAFATTAVYFRTNHYHSTGSFAIAWGANTRTSLSSWQTSDGQEKNGATLYGLQGDPQLRSPATSPSAVSVSDLSPVYVLRPRREGLASRSGADLSSLFSVSPGSRDFFGTAVASPHLPTGASAGLPTGSNLGNQAISRASFY